MTDNQKKANIYFFAFISFFISSLISIIVLQLFPFSSNDVSIAKTLKIISLTTLTGYSKSRESLFYLLSIIINLLISISIAFSFRKSLTSFKAADENICISKKITIAELFIIIPTIIFITYYTNFFYANWFNHYTFFSEEGQHLSYVNDLFHGKNLYKDTYVIYGPLMEYPLYLMMKLFSKDILTSRLYTYLLDIAGFCLIYVFLRKLLARMFTAVTATILFIAFYFPVFPAPNGSISRVAFGFLPLLLISLFSEKNNSFFLFLSGCTAALVFLFSQDTGAATTIASAGLIIYIFSIVRSNITLLLKSLGIFLLGFITACTPVFIVLLITGAFYNYINQTVLYPYFVTLGFGNIPSPSIVDSLSLFLLNPNSNSAFNLYSTLTYYWVFIAYLFFLSLLTFINFTESKRNREFILVLGTFIFGVIILRGALSRSGIDRNYLLLPPAIIISLFFIERTVLNIFSKLKQYKISFMEICFSLFLIGGIISYSAIPARWCIATFVKSLYSKLVTWSLEIPAPQMEELNIKGAQDISIPEVEAKRVKGIVNYINSKIKPGESVFVFPNDATFYFLLDIPIPSCFGVLHDAATGHLKELVLNDLKRIKPRFIINAEGIWQVDRIPEEIEFPGIKSFIDKNYIIVFEIEGLKILEPVGTI